MEHFIVEESYLNIDGCILDEGKYNDLYIYIFILIFLCFQTYESFVADAEYMRVKYV